ncbi:MAG: hypothetical protein NXI31_20290 [bacterium]|nr:hypothetical protein [bacterium]
MNRNDEQPRTGPECWYGWPAPLIDVLVTLSRQRRLVAGVLFVGLVLALGAAFGGRSYYRATAIGVLMPREKPVFDMSVRTPSLRTADGAGSRVGVGTLMLPPQTELYSELLRSERCLVAVIEAFRARLGLASPGEDDGAIVALRRMVNIVTTDAGLISVEVTADAPRLAADIANHILDQGRKASVEIERRMIEDVLDRLEIAVRTSVRRLEGDEVAMQIFLDEHRLLDPYQESTENLRQIRETQMIRDGLVRRRAELGQSYTAESPEIREATSQIDAANQRLGELRGFVRGSGEASYGALLLEHSRLQQRIDATTDLVRTLEAQREVLQVRALQTAGAVVAITPATEPTSAAGPRRKRVMLIGAALTVISAWILAALRERWRAAMKDPVLAVRLREVRRRAPQRTTDRQGDVE